MVLAPVTLRRRLTGKGRFDMGKILYMDCASGISGDMSVAALLDLGADADVLEKVLKSIPVQGFEVKISQVKKAAIDCMDFNVILDRDHENHDHDMEYLHGHEHHHDDHEHHHEHRNLQSVIEIIDGTDMTENAKKLAKKIFNIIAEAECKAHDTTPDKVHFHEVGAVDSIVDIISFAVCFDNLDIEEVIVPGVSEGCGTIRCQHGLLSIPVPAVVNIAQSHKIAFNMTDVKGELVTPTGAAIIAATRTGTELPENFVIDRVGMGAGKREYELPGILRFMFIEKNNEADTIYRLETDIDDCTGEALGYTLERLYGAGAREAHFSPIYMKKNRPAYELVVICTGDKIKEMEEIIFSETTTIGIRRMQMERTVLERKFLKVDTLLGSANVKLCGHNGKWYAYPEYEDVKKLAVNNGISYNEAYRVVAETAGQGDN